MAEQLRDREGKVLGLQEPDTYTPTVLPASRARITELPECRRRAFLEFLSRLLGVAPSLDGDSPSGEAAPPPAPSSTTALSPEVQAVLDRACALCQGFCCTGGGNHAYLTVETIRIYMATHPDQGPQEVLAAYLGRIRNETVSGSCIFHQPGGCGLPREMRSETCNRYFCNGLKEFQKGLTHRDRARGFFTATIGEAIVAAAFCNGAETRLVPISPPADRDLHASGLQPDDACV
jgi:hypothetical protein